MVEDGSANGDDAKPLFAYEATVELIDKDGVVVGSAAALAGTDEMPSQGQKGYGRRNAAMAFAQTRATNRAIRSKLGWILALGGVEMASVDEMPPQQQQRTRPAGSNHIPANRPQAAKPAPQQGAPPPPPPVIDAPVAEEKPQLTAAQLTEMMRDAKQKYEAGNQQSGEDAESIRGLGAELGFDYNTETQIFTEPQSF